MLHAYRSRSTVYDLDHKLALWYVVHGWYETGSTLNRVLEHVDFTAPTRKHGAK